MRHDPIIYFAGAAQHSLCSWLMGHHVLEVYEANLGEEGDSMARYRNAYVSMANECGAYMVMTEQRARVEGRRGKKTPYTPDELEAKIEGYITFSVQHGEFYDWNSSYDDITGGPDGNRRNWVRCKDAGIPRLLPVFHQGEPFSLLQEYIAGSDYIGLGFQRPIKDEAAWLDECFSLIPEGKWVHGFAMTNYLRWPFRSADSTTWLKEMLAIDKESGQGKSALRYLTKSELVDLVVKKYHRQWRQDQWRGTIGAAAGRGQQLDFREALNALDAASR